MATAQSQLEVGSLLRQWRERRRVTQLELALEADISARHLSFVETGRSKPGREMLLRVSELAIELLFPADRTTAETLRELESDPPRQ